MATREDEKTQNMFPFFKREGEGASQGTCIKDLWTKTMGERIECGRLGVGRARESNGG